MNRRRFVDGAALGLAAVQLAVAGCARSGGTEKSSEGNNAMTQAQESAAAGSTAIRTFPKLNVPEAEVSDLRSQIRATRWPTRELVSDDSQGVQLQTMQALATYWAGDYDWRKCEAKLNAIPQFVTQVDGQDIHFIHVRSQQANALPLIITHGWPGSYIEQTKVIDLLTNPTAHGASEQDAFHLVIPSIPGYGYSPEPATLGWDPVRIAKAWVVLMERLGYGKFVAQGGDWGAAVTQETRAIGACQRARHPQQYARYGTSRRFGRVQIGATCTRRPFRRRAARLRAAQGLLCAPSRLRY
jgi:hypothetical protein